MPVAARPLGPKRRRGQQQNGRRAQNSRSFFHSVSFFVSRYVCKNKARCGPVVFGPAVKRRTSGVKRPEREAKRPADFFRSFFRRFPVPPGRAHMRGRPLHGTAPEAADREKFRPPGDFPRFRPEKRFRRPCGQLRRERTVVPDPLSRANGPKRENARRGTGRTERPPVRTNDNRNRQRPPVRQRIHRQNDRSRTASTLCSMLSGRAAKKSMPSSCSTLSTLYM